MMIKIAPSILAADILNIRNDVKKVIKAGCDWLHIDIMDGHFVPNLSFGPSIVKALRSEFDMHLDVHLMIDRPERYIAQFIQAGANSLTIHKEATENPKKVLDEIKQMGAIPGISVKPNTPIESIENILPHVGMVLVMTVEPGFGGQAFMPAMLNKVKWLRDNGYEGHIEVDGGVGIENAQVLIQNGADVLVMGTAIFTYDQPEALINNIRAMAHLS